jgi:hypothetical protein
MKPAQPFEPETIESVLLRFKDALTPDYDVEHIAAHPDEAPSKLRKHVFDFKDGVRMIASVDRFENVRKLHLSFSMDTPPPEITPTLDWFLGRVNELCFQFGGGLPIQKQRTKVALHFWFHLPHDTFPGGAETAVPA